MDYLEEDEIEWDPPKCEGGGDGGDEQDVPQEGNKEQQEQEQSCYHLKLEQFVFFFSGTCPCAAIVKLAVLNKNKE